MSVALPTGVLKVPLTISETHPAVVLADSVANVDSEVATIRVPRKCAWAFREGDQLYLILKTAAAATITAGTIKVLIADANKVMKVEVVGPTPTANFATLDDQTKIFRLGAGFDRKEDQYIIIVYKGADVSDKTKTALKLTGISFTEL